MGCDIHLYRERKIDGVWESDTIEEEDGECMNYQGFRLKGGRSYALFAVLSGVRMYFELPVKPPAEDRGYPDDATGVNQRCLEYWEGDAHSAGHLTLGELTKLKDDWEQAIVLVEGDNRVDPTYSLAELENLLECVHGGDYFRDTPPDEGRILFFYDN